MGRIFLEITKYVKCYIHYLNLNTYIYTNSAAHVLFYENKQ